MVKKRDAAAVTRADMDAVRADLGAVKADLGALRSEVRSDIDAAIADLRRSDIEPMKKDIRRLMLESVTTNERITSIRDEVRRDLRDFRMEFTGTLDAFTTKMETIWRETMVFPKMLDEQGRTLRGHETRIQALEARRPAP